MTHPSVNLVRIEDVDLAVHRWFDRTVDAHVESTTSDRKKVPVLFSSGERFATSRTKKGIRDNNGVLVLPLISVRRTSVSNDPSMQGLGTETDTIQFARQVNPKTNDIKNLNLLRDVALRRPDRTIYDVFVVPFPERSIMNYEVIVQAQYMTQMNAILEKVMSSQDIRNSFLAPFENDGRRPPIGVPFEERPPIERGYVVGFFPNDSNDTGNLEEFTDQERIVRWTTTVQVPASLQLDPEGTRPAIQVRRTSSDLSFGKETCHFSDDPEELARIFGRR